MSFFSRICHQVDRFPGVLLFAVQRRKMSTEGTVIRCLGNGFCQNFVVIYYFLPLVVFSFMCACVYFPGGWWVRSCGWMGGREAVVN